jgi:acyl-CoA reductase-like NAD-dependent aldehyde dehydrogenase
MAVEETGMGIVEDKVIKNNYASEYIYNAYKNTKTCGIIEEDKAFGTKKIAEPIGVIAAVIPTTNPTSTAIFKCLLALKTRNAIIISPHPRAKNSTIAAAKLVLEAADEAENITVTPKCLFDAAAMYEQQGNAEKAIELYNRIKNEYPQAPEAANIERFIGRTR